MSLVTRDRHQITVEQIYAIAELEYDDTADISRAVGVNREIEVEFTSSGSGGRHLYVKDHDGHLYHVARNGSITQCGRS